MEPHAKRAFRLVSTHAFERLARKFLRLHPELAGLLDDTLALLETDPFAPRLRLHPLGGRHRGKHAVRLTYEARIVLVLQLVEHKVVLLDIGGHDSVYRD